MKNTPWMPLWRSIVLVLLAANVMTLWNSKVWLYWAMADSIPPPPKGYSLIDPSVERRRVEFNGTIHEFPQGTTDDQIREALRSTLRLPEHTAESNLIVARLESLYEVFLKVSTGTIAAGKYPTLIWMLVAATTGACVCMIVEMFSRGVMWLLQKNVRMPRLSAWQRISIAAAILWVIGVFSFGDDRNQNSRRAMNRRATFALVIPILPIVGRWIANGFDRSPK